MKMVKWIVGAVLLVAILAGSTAIYNGYLKNNGGGIVPVDDLRNDGQTADENNGSNGTEDNVTQDKTDIGSDDDADTNNKNDDSAEDGTNGVTISIPDFTAIDYEGNTVKLSDYVGKPIVLNFWATWCVYCKMEMPDFSSAQKAYPDVVFLMVNATGVNNETVEGAKKYVESEGFDFTVLFDTNGEALNAYGVASFPTTYFISAEGELVARGIGALSYANLEEGIGMITE